ncbi:hypothetical protein B4098_0494 [Heyndrickxia coagulans]|uniref:Uncharacterized protein n=1 Tax=Heyndrickxia coagulans TaxID=1398 RepID=A0A150K1I6_HEYCO|nr:hypothetical protein B4098_0494 [Heyndrickxia coagulans]
MEKPPLLQIEDLTVSFQIQDTYYPAVDHVSLEPLPKCYIP